VSFGGAGGLHAVELARGLGIPRVIIPKNPGVFSAYGMVIADTTRDLSKTILKDADSVNFLELNAIFEKLILSGAKELEIAGIDPESIRSQRTMDLRYKGQSFEINVPFSEGFREEFHNAHERLYGFCKRQELIEVVTLRVRLSSPTATGSEKENWSVFEASRSVENKRNPKTDGALRVINRDHLKENDIIEGPCVIMEANATTWAPEGCSGVVDRSGQIILSTMSINS
jgi:N-methylhydantoinase A